LSFRDSEAVAVTQLVGGRCRSVQNTRTHNDDIDMNKSHNMTYILAQMHHCILRPP